MKNRLYFTLLVLSFFLMNLSYVIADEGMWLPLLLGEKRYERMKEMGCKLSPEEIYSINHSSLKDAVVLFGTGCTGVMVSDQGLLFTNHHCGIGNIQAHSTLEHNYLVDGFWAKSKDEELLNPSLKVYFLVRMTDVTDKVTSEVKEDWSESKRSASIRRNSDEVIRTATQIKNHGYIVKPFFGGNQYFLFEYEIFSDVRLVGAPPLNIGKFGGDTDNWVWPRHTGDFSIYRVYADKDNNPTSYAKDNIPYRPRKVAPISIKGLKKDDFTMILGYPGVTDEYSYSGKAENLLNKVYPLRVNLRAKRLQIIANAMKQSPAVKIQYTAKYASIANGWKKWEGAIKGLNRANAMEVIRQKEDQFSKHIVADSLNKKYGTLMSGFQTSNQKYSQYYNLKDLLEESVNSVELMQMVAPFYSLFINYPVGDTTSMVSKINKYKVFLRNFYKNYNKPLDSKVFSAVMEIYYKETTDVYHTEYLNKEVIRNKHNFDAWASSMYAKSLFCDTTKLFGKLESGKLEKLKSDPAIEMYGGFYKMSSMIIQPNLKIYDNAMDSLNRLYQQALLSMDKDKEMYPDANQTFRIAYGKVEGYKAADAVTYDYYTTVNGILEKEDAAIDDYQVSDVLKKVIKRKDFGPYADSTGVVHVCFSASNHTTGGNSGSPVFNGNGELVGLNFDRCWEGTMSDILYDPDQCRNITLDIRYLLFVVDKIGGAGNLIKEMQILR